jgi:predicted Fe-Mo cluster-binding NifX family protein
MKIAVAANSDNESSQISEKAGRAPYYLIFNEAGELIETLPNPFSRGGGGAGFGVSKMLADKSVNIVIAGRFGANMESDLVSRGIKFYEKSGKVKEEILKLA